MRRRRLPIAALLLISLTGLQSSGQAEPTAEAEVGSVLPTKELQTWMDESGVPGVSITVIKDFEIHWTLAFGMADARSGRPVTPTTLFQAASISKPVMAAATAVLADQGQLDLDADVNNYLRSWQFPQRAEPSAPKITPRMLLSHTSGLADGFGFPGYGPSEPLPDTVSILNGLPPAKTVAVRSGFRPMRQSRYSGGGSVVMQLLLMDVTGQAFPDLMRHTLLQPLGMLLSNYQQPLHQSLWHSAAVAHDSNGQSLDVPWKVYPELAAAGLWSTSEELATLVRALQRTAAGDVVMPFSRALVRDLWRPVGVGSFSAGFNVFQQGEGWYFAHMGSNQGYRSFLMAHQTKGYGLVVMTNGDGGEPLIENICRRIQMAYDWDVQETGGQFRYGGQRSFGCLPAFGAAQSNPSAAG
ncbi:serine hydrolase [Synechococcus sp. UW105]|uniref:serine hydrolase domain-containing protein n=1 Tax=Synechococcus sp. UW105 TaxID=337067 RepID=UPI000E0E8636|nr:serine hydrolase domain-containing protein [Synechococcus sp. UW105]